MPQNFQADALELEALEAVLTAIDAATNIPLSVRRILVVDDDVRAAKAVRAVLADAGYEPEICHIGADAIVAVQKSKPAIAVVDVHLPDMSGLILTQQLRQLLGPEIPIIVMSGDTSMETLNSLKYVGATYFFSKPIQPVSLLGHIKQCLS